MNDVAIKVEHVGKKFSKSLKRSMLYGGLDVLANTFGKVTDSTRLRKGEFWAVNGVCFELKKGETLGIIGPNGAGKTTMLKMLNGIFMPDKGKIEIKGRVGALIQIGAGFHPMLTGRENIYINGAVLGMSKREIDKKFDSIVDFADIGDFLDTPVKFYSSGMYVRLGFAIAVHCEPDILLVDEVLAVGDMAFQSKCYKKMSEIRKKTSVLIVSHLMPTIQNICNRCIVLSKGRELYQGNVIDCVSKYYELLSTVRLDDDREKIKYFKDEALEIKSIEIIRNGKEETNKVFSGDSVEFVIHLNSKKVIPNPQISLTFNADTYSGFSTKYDSFNIDKIFSETTISLKIKHLGLGAGIYNVSIGIWDNDMLNTYYWNWNALRMVIENPKNYVGRFEFEHEWSYGPDK